MKYQVTCIRGFNDLKIYINGILHMHIETDKYVGMQSYYMGTKKQKMFIEIKFENKGTLKAQYHREEIFLAVLKALEENI